jgi:hypothetical protein
MAAEYAIEAWEKTNLSLSFTWYDADDKPVNLNGYSAYLQVKPESKYDKPAVIDASTNNGKITFDADIGKIMLDLSADDLDVRPWGYKYDLLMVIDDNSRRLLYGDFTVNPVVTKPEEEGDS